MADHISRIQPLIFPPQIGLQPCYLTGTAGKQNLLIPLKKILHSSKDPSAVTLHIFRGTHPEDILRLIADHMLYLVIPSVNSSRHIASPAQYGFCQKREYSS